MPALRATQFKVKQRGLDNLLDEMDQFLTEIINQQWSLNHPKTNASRTNTSAKSNQASSLKAHIFD